MAKNKETVKSVQQKIDKMKAAREKAELNRLELDEKIDQWDKDIEYNELKLISLTMQEQGISVTDAIKLLKNNQEVDHVQDHQSSNQ
ncbi:TPA: hypothetical protein U1B25_001096 [Streptococcus suis]|nr:hypothetical protein [Streptococcus suis]